MRNRTARQRLTGWATRAGRAWWNAIASTVGVGSGHYNATDAARKILRGLRPAQGTANEALTASLPPLRVLCRSLERNNPTARAAIEGLTANIVGTGIALKVETGSDATDRIMQDGWDEFVRTADATERQDFYGMQSQACREWGTVGEFLWRLVVDPSRLDRGLLPLCLLALESEWLIDQPVSNAGVLTHVAGVDLDRYGRPVNYYLQNPEIYSDKIIEIVPAREIIHEFEKRRALQARGEPPLAPVVERLHQEGDLVSAELEAAKNTAAMAMVITSEVQDPESTDFDGDPVTDIRLGGVARLFPGEDVKAFSHDRPSQQIAPFRQMLRGDIAAAMRVGQRWLDRDVSRANYSSLRCDMLDNERLISPVRQWFGSATAGRSYRAAAPWIALRAGIRIPPLNFRLVPEGQPYVDPEKDAKATLLAIAGGLTTWEREIGRRGEDAGALLNQLRTELKDPLLAKIFAANLPKGAIAADEGKQSEKSDKENANG